MAEGDQDSRYRALLAQQLEMNVETWHALESHGVGEGSELRLDFAYRAPNEDGAERLRSLLEQETDYEVRLASEGLWRKQWSVLGSTQSTTVSLETLDQWVDWMITAGLQEHCEFDGWGAEVP